MVRYLFGSLALAGLLLVYSVNTTLAWSALLVVGMVAARGRSRSGPEDGRQVVTVSLPARRLAKR